LCPWRTINEIDIDQSAKEAIESRKLVLASTMAKWKEAPTENGVVAAIALGAVAGAIAGPIGAVAGASIVGIFACPTAGPGSDTDHEAALNVGDHRI
jgi:hypothetical protein